jgi:alpha-beta hydrolase superfamily lysophospholipase
MYRLAFVPVIIAAGACAIVWQATHPRIITAEVDPASQGIYYDPVTFVSADQTRIEAWLIPTLDAKTVLELQNKALRATHPAVILVHDMGRRREQMLPLIKPLHDEGFVIVALNLRGGGVHTATGQTFGLSEAADVSAAVEMLRKRVFVDPKRIAIVGFGTGATASLLAAQNDPTVAAVVAERPIRNVAELIIERMMPKQRQLCWLAPLCKWTFEIAYSIDAEEVDLANFKKLLDTRKVLMVDNVSPHPDPADPKTVEQIKTFLTAVFPAKTESVAGALR